MKVNSANSYLLAGHWGHLRWRRWLRWPRCWYQSKIAICSPFNLFQSVTNVVMLNEISSKSKPLILNLNLVLLKMYVASEFAQAVNICWSKDWVPFSMADLPLPSFLVLIAGRQNWNPMIVTCVWLRTTCQTIVQVLQDLVWGRALCQVRRHFSFCHCSHRRDHTGL